MDKAEKYKGIANQQHSSASNDDNLSSEREQIVVGETKKGNKGNRWKQETKFVVGQNEGSQGPSEQTCACRGLFPSLRIMHLFEHAQKRLVLSQNVFFFQCLIVILTLCNLMSQERG